MLIKIMMVVLIVCYLNVFGLIIVWLFDVIMFKILIVVWIIIGSKILFEYRYVEVKN